MSNLIVYKASAGSGKTFRLAAEYIKLVVSDPLEYKRILAVTFTNKATAEMKGRILEELKALADGKKTAMLDIVAKETQVNPDLIPLKASKALSNILHDYSRFSVSTIDSFVQRIIQALLWEIGQQGGADIRLDFNPVLERAADIMLDESVDNPALFEWLKRMGESQLEEGKTWDIRNALVTLGKELFSESFRLMKPNEISKFTDKEQVEKLKVDLNKILNGTSSQISQIGKESLRIIAEHGLCEKDFVYGGGGVYGFFVKCSVFESGDIIPPLDGARVQKAVDDPTGESWVKAEDRKNKPKFAEITNLVSTTLHPNLLKIKEIAEKSYLSYNSSRLVLRNLNSLAILTDLWLTIRKLSTEEGFMLLADSGPLLREFVKETDAPFVYEKAGTRYEHFMIDEFQDTSVIQWQNFKPLIENSLAQDGFSMVVGDVKQAIYRWRNGDWRILSSGLEKDFELLGVTYKPLDVNRRSLPSVVEFNNLFFTGAAKVLNEVTNEMLADKEFSSVNRDDFSKAYENVEQKVSKENSGSGYVEVKFIPDVEKSFKENLSKYLPSLISDIQKRGYKAGDIAILVRANREGQEIANMLLTHKQSNPDAFGSFDVVSQEGLLLKSSPAIQFCIAAIKTVYQPTDSITRSHFAAGLKVIRGDETTPWSTYFSDEFCSNEVEWLKDFRTQPVQETFEAIIKRYGLLDRKKELAYISELHEQIINLSRKGPNDVGRFIEWWDDEGDRISLTMPESENAITITTIHKSKGLQFPIVIIPRGDWPFSQSNRKPLLWVDSTLKPFDGLPKYPIKSIKESEKSLFAKPYIEDELQIVIDNVNLLYVAFTRAENELFVFCPLKQVKNDNKYSSTSPLIATILGGISSLNLINRSETDVLGNQVSTFSIGIPIKKGEDKLNEKVGSLSWTLDSYSVGEAKVKVRQRLESVDFFEDVEVSHSHAISYGKLMHSLFSRIKYSSDVDKALDGMLFEGVIDVSERINLKIKIESLLNGNPYSDWFSDAWEVKNEISILSPSSSTYRPDRVIIKNDEVVVIDYKFGSESESYKHQVQRYVKLIQQMGYSKVDGFIWYVDSNKLDGC